MSEWLSLCTRSMHFLTTVSSNKCGCWFNNQTHLAGVFLPCVWSCQSLQTTIDLLVQFAVCPDWIPAPCSTVQPVVWAAASSWASAPVRDQSQAPISATTTTVDAAGQKQGSGLTSCRTDPASQGLNAGPVGDSQPLCVISTLVLPRGFCGGRRRERGRKVARGTGVFYDLWTMIHAS